MKKKATLNIDPELHRELKIEATKQGLKISEFVQQLLKEGLEKKKSTSNATKQGLKISELEQQLLQKMLKKGE